MTFPPFRKSYRRRTVLEMPGFSLEPVMGGQYPLDGFEEALAAIQGGAPGKMLLIP